MTVSVVFTLTKPDANDAAVKLRDGDGGGPEIQLRFGLDNKARADLDPAADYSVSWVMIGAMGDPIKLTWETANASGKVFSGTINAKNSTPYQGDRRRAENLNYLAPVGG